MSNMGDDFAAMKQAQKDRKHTWRDRRLATFDEAWLLACDNGMNLTERVFEVHYQLTVYDENRNVRWLWNLYPTTGRIYADPNHKGPFLAVPHDWNFPDVVKAAIQAKGKA